MHLHLHFHHIFIIIEAGHMTKAHAIAYLPMVVAGVLYTYRGKMLLGSVLTGIESFSTNFSKSSTNHILFGLVIIFISYFSIL